MFPENKLKTRVRNHEKLAGTTMVLNDPVVAELLGNAGFDYVWIDTEHGPIDYHTLELILMGCTAGGCGSLVRVPWNDQVMVKRVLDIGPDGIIFPMILTAEDADYAMKSCLYPPEGIRGYGPTRAIRWGKYPPPEFIAANTDNIVRFIQIEHHETVKNLREIVKNPYIDGYIYGPCDMSGSVNDLFNYRDKATQDLFKEATKILRENGKYFGICVGAYDVPALEVWREMQVPMITSGMDTVSIMRGSREVLKAIGEFQKDW